MLGVAGSLAICLVVFVFSFCLMVGSFVSTRLFDGRRQGDNERDVELLEVRSGSFYRQPRLQRGPRPEPVYEEIVGDHLEVELEPDQLSEIYSEVFSSVSNPRGSRLFWIEMENRR